MKKLLTKLCCLLLVLFTLLPSFSLAENWVCRYCNVSNSANFCTQCGRSKAEATKQATCPHCGAACASNDLYCAKCGTSLKTVTLKVGQSVYFGSYEQNNGVESIEWIVLSVNKSSVKLLSRYVLDCRQMNSSNSVYWLKTKLYSWLQSTFYQTAFSAKEQSYILADSDGTLVNIPSVDDLTDTSAGFDCDPDYEDPLRVGYATDYAVDHGLWIGPTTGACNYFTRTEVNSRSAGLIWHLHTTGSFGKTGKDRKNEGVRPLIYVSADYFAK